MNDRAELLSKLEDITGTNWTEDTNTLETMTEGGGWAVDDYGDWATVTQWAGDTKFAADSVAIANIPKAMTALEAAFSAYAEAMRKTDAD